MLQNLVTALGNEPEKTEFFGYFVAVVLLAIPIANMLSRAWQEAFLSKFLLNIGRLFGRSVLLTQGVMFGLFTALLLLMAYDTKKRWQAVLLGVGTIIALFFLFLRGSLPRLFANLGAAGLWIFLGLVVGFGVGGGYEAVGQRSAEPVEFRKAASRLYAILVAIIVIGFLEYHVRYPHLLYIVNGEFYTYNGPITVSFVSNWAFVDTFATIGMALVGRQFIQYDAETQFLVLGPRESGKSLFLLGAYLEALERSRTEGWRTPMNPSREVVHMVERMESETAGWFINATPGETVGRHSFRFVNGTVFPKNVWLESIDYAGEHLREIPQYLVDPDVDESDTVLELAASVREADTLILLIDIDRFVSNESLEVSPYFDILRVTRGKDVLLVATKCDLLVDDFRRDEGLDPDIYFQDFQEYVTDRLSQNQNVAALLTETTAEVIHPVFYETRETDDGRTVPMRDGNSVVTVGFGALLERLGR